MANDSNINSLFKEHSLKEIESLRDNLASEIQKKTDLLKSIVKEKYRDIVETSDAIKSMKLNLKQVEQSLWNLDKNVSDFYIKVRDPQETSRKNSSDDDGKPVRSTTREEDQAAQKLIKAMSNMWSCLDSGDLREAVFHLDELSNLVETYKDLIANSQCSLLKNLEVSSQRAKVMMKNHLWHKVRTATADQICIIGGSNNPELYYLSLSCSLEFPAEKLQQSLSDMSYHAQIKRYQLPAHYNSQTNQVEPYPTDPKLITAAHVPIPRQISPELSAYLFEVCDIINKIAGFNLNRSSIVHSLGKIIEQLVEVYTKIAPQVDEVLKGETKRRRALQLHYDLLFLRILLNSSKDVGLIERLDPEISDLCRKYELMLDSIEYYSISSALHENVLALSQSTMRLYGLLIPHLH